jgi:hypothetical protein
MIAHVTQPFTGATPPPDPSQNDDSASRAAPARDASSAPAANPRARAWRFGAAIFVAVALASAIGYLAFTVPGSWFPHASPRTWSAKDLAFARGSARLVGNDLVVTAPGADGIALVTVTTDFRASDYAGIAWSVRDLQDNADVRLLWRTDVRPDKLESMAIPVQSGQTLPVVMAGHPAWIGHVTGLALAVHGALAQPVLVAGVTARPMGAIGIVRARLHDWFAFEPWNGASINTITGGADNQPVSLPPALAVVGGACAIIALLLRRYRRLPFEGRLPAVLAGFFLVGWMVLDGRWTLNLLRQEHATAIQYGGKDLAEKRLASEDAPLYAFVEKPLAIMPKTPERVFVAADADDFRGRAAYHLYPHSAYFSPRSNELPAPSAMRPGDWILVFRRRGIQFDRAQSKLRWDGNAPVNAEVKLVEPGAALFVVR